MRVEPNAKDMARAGALLRNPDLRTGMGAAARARTGKNSARTPMAESSTAWSVLRLNHALKRE